jgi:uncharacterized protein (UPF0147 family)
MLGATFWSSGSRLSFIESLHLGLKMDATTFVFIFAIIGAIYVIFTRASIDYSRERKAEEALNEYRKTLAKITRDPTNQNLRNQALENGRVYHALSKKIGVTAKDELSIMNDINAAAITHEKDQIKICPYCDEKIRYKAIKCRFCGEPLSNGDISIG